MGSECLPSGHSFDHVVQTRGTGDINAYANNPQQMMKEHCNFYALGWLTMKFVLRGSSVVQEY